jgi:hypothetical protein
MASYTVDAAGSVEDKDYTFRINGLAAADTSASDDINKLKMIEAQYDQLAGLVAAKNSLAQGWAGYNANAAQIAKGEAQLAAAKQDLESGEAEYSAKSGLQPPRYPWSNCLCLPNRNLQGHSGRSLHGVLCPHL